VIFDKRYEFGFLFDHIGGHAKKRSVGLDVKSMNEGFCGELLRNSKIVEHDDQHPKKSYSPFSYQMGGKGEGIAANSQGKRLDR
jgi:hypothetical protein